MEKILYIQHNIHDNVYLRYHIYNTCIYNIFNIIYIYIYLFIYNVLIFIYIWYSNNDNNDNNNNNKQ